MQSDPKNRRVDLPDRYHESWFAPEVFEDPEAFQSAYNELRSIARYLVRGEAYSPTLQATELVNEAFLKLYTSPIVANDRRHLLALLSRYMRQVLIDRARRKKSDKRSAVVVPLELAVGKDAGQSEPPWQLIDEELARLTEVEPLLAEVFELHYFAGVPLRDIAPAWDKSERTIKRYWRAARAWISERLRHRLAGT